MKYAGKKVITMIATILIVSFLVFLAFSIIPGDPALSKLGTSATPEAVTALREEMGLNRPLPVRFAEWAVSFIRGDMGTSYSYSMPVKDMIMDKIPITLTLTCMAFLIIVVISIPLGIFTARHEGGMIDRCIYIINQIFMSVPAFFAGIIITWIFGLVLKIFTPGGYVSYEKGILPFVGYLLFPAIAIALPKIAMTVKLLRSSVLSEVKQDYVRTAYSRGENTKGVLYQHVLRNAVMPVVTFLGMTFADILVGSFIIEQVFGIPGLGRILLSSIANRDYPVVQAVIVLIAFWVIFINCVVDIVYKCIDPRIDAA